MSVPEMVPAVALTESEAGKPVAENCNGAKPPVGIT